MRPSRSRRSRRTRRTRRGGDLNNGANAALHVNPNDPPPYVPQLIHRNANVHPYGRPPANVIHPIEPAGPIHFPEFAFHPVHPQHVNMDVSGAENRMNVDPSPNQGMNQGMNRMGGKRRARRTRRHRTRC